MQELQGEPDFEIPCGCQHAGPTGLRQAEVQTLVAALPEAVERTVCDEPTFGVTGGSHPAHVAFSDPRATLDALVIPIKAHAPGIAFAQRLEVRDAVEKG